MVSTVWSVLMHTNCSLWVSCVDSSALRHMVANHNVTTYIHSLSQPVASDNAYSAETEPPTEEDAYTRSIADPELQSVLRWRNYLLRLRNGSWGDHIVLQSIANMFTVTINVLCSQSATMVPIEPNNGPGSHELYVGLILQYHYVGLDKLTENTDGNDGENCSDTTAVNNVASEQDSQELMYLMIL